MPLAGLYLRLRQKQDELSRLRTCRDELDDCRSELLRHESQVRSPVLMTNTWSGNLAERFEQLRDQGMVPSYKDIVGVQLESAFQILLTKISETEQEIISLQDSIVTAKSAMVVR